MWVYIWSVELKKAYIGLVIEPVTFSYTWADQTYTVRKTWTYRITCKWAWSNTSAGWLWQWNINLTQWDVLSVMVWQTWNSAAKSTTTYGFGGSGNQWAGRAWWGLSWVFTGSWTILATDSARALVIWWGAGAGNSRWNGGMWWWETWQAGQGWSYGTAWGGGTQTWRGSGWNAWANQFNGWDGSKTYWQWWWGWWWWWNWSIWDGSGDDDRNGWGGSGYVISTATNRVLTQWGWAGATSNWEVTIEFIS